MIDRDQLREAIAQGPKKPLPVYAIVLEAARLVADPDTLIITKVELRHLLWPFVMDAYHFEDDDPDDIADAEDILAQILDALLEGQPK